ncbi:uncharacterized protein LOC129412235 isoform X2 [Boleophthalmus pectinirostris]|uniref:uncharacterized protein LOC129412235 isoform X2 n=1 Tax=Boleophthalmus pectinirostris TaxID=150288 RepID=UPI00242DDB98|nr:uncharacterized protein LOC129412235 isoform X2 [Boleophthalmus pectinirostris]
MTGLPIKHEQLIKQLIDAVQLPSRLAIMKCKAHTKGTDSISLGNQAADQAAKKAANYDARNMLVHVDGNVEMLPDANVIDATYIKEIQEAAGVYEQSAWKQRGATKDATGIWRNHEGRILAPTPLLRMLFEEYHTPTHRSYEAISKHIDLWWHPHLKPIMQYWIDECHVCQTMNPKKSCKPPPGTYALPNKPFERIVMDFTDMGPEMRVRGYRYLLVIVYVIRSDNGTHFTAKIVRDVLKALNITQRFGTVYHAASQGVCERMNATVKRKLAKVWKTTKLDWVTALPFVLMDIRNSVNKTTSYSPHLLLTGREMHKPEGPFTEDAPFIDWDKQHHAYVQQLQEIVMQLHKCRQRTHDLQDEDGENQRNPDTAGTREPKKQPCPPSTTEAPEEEEKKGRKHRRGV